MEKFKIIDLLNKIANGEEVPKRIRFGSYIYEYKEDELGFVDYVRIDTSKHLFGEDYIMDDVNLNEEVEIIEEEKKIEKIDIGDSVLGFDDSKQDIYIGKNPENEAFAIKINEIIDYLNKEK